MRGSVPFHMCVCNNSYKGYSLISPTYIYSLYHVTTMHNIKVTSVCNPNSPPFIVFHHLCCVKTTGETIIFPTKMSIDWMCIYIIYIYIHMCIYIYIYDQISLPAPFVLPWWHPEYLLTAYPELDLALPDSAGDSPLHLAAYNGHLGTVPWQHLQWLDSWKITELAMELAKSSKWWMRHE